MSGLQLSVPTGQAATEQILPAGRCLRGELPPRWSLHQTQLMHQKHSLQGQLCLVVLLRGTRRRQAGQLAASQWKPRPACTHMLKPPDGATRTPIFTIFTVNTATTWWEPARPQCESNNSSTRCSGTKFHGLRPGGQAQSSVGPGAHVHGAMGRCWAALARRPCPLRPTAPHISTWT